MKAAGIIIFAAGAAAGAVASYLIAKRKFEDLAQAEIASVKEVYSKRAAAREKPDLSEFTEIVESKGYSAPTVKEKPKSKAKEPYVISPDEFADDDEYDKITLTLYADGVLADEENDVVDISIVGEDSLSEIGAFDEDFVYVRNEARQADYEVIEDERSYKDVMAKSPQKIGGKSD